jgi:carbamoyltransferase
VWILGLSCFRDDATAALLKDGVVVGISEEERFLRVKHAVERPSGLFVSSLGESASLDGFELRYFPEQSINYLLREAGIELTDIDVVAYDFDFDRRIRHWDRFVPVSELSSVHQNEQSVAVLRYWQRLLADFAERCGARLEYVPHHLAHASGTVFGSGYRETSFLIMDALGELESSTLGYFDGDFHFTRQIALPHSLGIVYAAVTSFLGFRPFSDEQKTMGLSAYGDPTVFAADFRKILRPDADGFTTDPDAVWGSDVIEVDRPPRLAGILGVPANPSAAEVCRPPYTHIAAALQQALELVVNHLADQALATTRSRRLCLAGGVALNCAANGTLLTRGDIDEMYIQPQAGDSGTALGAAYYAHFRATGSRPEPLPHAYWGPGYSGSEVRALLDRLKLPYRQTDQPWDAAAELLADGDVVGWFQGRSECGPRALGNRSILADPRDAANRDRINMVVKDREWWRPFAASILDEQRSRYLASDAPSPFMLLTIPLTGLGRRDLAAAAHVDGTTRPQTVSAAANPRYHRLIRAFQDRTGVGAVLNTSLNVKSEPLANDPMHAIANLYTTAMDALVIENFVLVKQRSPAESAEHPPTRTMVRP